MTEATMKPKPAKAATVIPMFEMPKFGEMPKFDMPHMEVPAAFREFAEKGVAQTKDAYEKIKAAAEQNTEMLETFYSTASKGSTEYGLKVIEVARANTNAYFDFVGSLFGVKSPSELVELTTAHSRSAVRDRDRAGQGACRARAEGRDRDRRADQERRREGDEEGRLRPFSVSSVSQARAGCPGFFFERRPPPGRLRTGAETLAKQGPCS